MTDSELGQAEFEVRLWKTLEDDRIGMLGPVGEPGRHMQPMTGFGEPSTRAIWFFARRDNDLVAQTAKSGEAMFCLVSKDREFWACVGGQLSQQHDADRIRKYWSPVTAAWLPEGKDDPNLTLLRLDVTDAQVWIADKGALRFAYEIVKANLTKTEPAVGDSAHLQFS